MKYDESAIGLYKDEQAVKEKLLNCSESLLDTIYGEYEKDTDRDHVNIRLRCALENYIVKYFGKMTDPIEIQKATFVLSYVYKKATQKYSNLKECAKYAQYYNSLFLKPENASLYSKNAIEYLTQQKSSYEAICQNIYQKWESGQTLSFDETKALMNFFCQTLKLTMNYDNNGLRKAQEKYFVYLISQTDTKTNNIYEIEFMCKFAMLDASLSEYNNNQLFPELAVTAYNTKNTSGYAVNDAFIMINQDSYKTTNLDIIQTACHEYRHIKQSYYAKKSRTNTAAFAMEKRNLICKYGKNFVKADGTKTDEYHLNYEYEEIELDAQKEGYSNAQFLADKYLRKYYSESKVEEAVKILKELEDFDKRRRPKNYGFKTYVIDEKTARLTTVYDYNVRRIKEIIKDHPEELNNNTTLKYFYNPDGSLKSFKEILNHQSNDDYMEISSDYILYGIDCNLLDNLDFKNDKSLNMDEVFKKLINAYKTTTYMLVDSAKQINQETYVNANQEQKINVSRQHIKIVQAITDKFLKEFEVFEEFQKNNNNALDESILRAVYSFIKETNESEFLNIFENQDKEKIEHLKMSQTLLYNKITKSKEKQRYNRRVGNTTTEELQKNIAHINSIKGYIPDFVLYSYNIEWPTGRVTSINDYLDKYVPFVLDGNEVTDAFGRRALISEIIKKEIGKRPINVPDLNSMENLSKEEKTHTLIDAIKYFKLLGDKTLAYYYEVNMDTIITKDMSEEEKIQYFLKKKNDYEKINNEERASYYEEILKNLLAFKMTTTNYEEDTKMGL